MKVIYLKSFLNDIKKVKDKKIKSKVKLILERLENVQTLEDLPNVKKLKVYPTAFRIRVGNYRMGVYKESESIEIVRFLKRNDIYKVFPK